MKNKKENRRLSKGDRIVIGFSDHLRHREWAREYEVIRTNGTSAYAIKVNDMRNPQRSEIRIRQGSFEIVENVMSFVSRRVFDDMGAYDEHVRRKELLAESREKVNKIIPSLTQSELDDIIIRFAGTVNL